MNKHQICTRTNNSHTKVGTFYQATLILQLISLQIKARSVAAEQCWLITGFCKGFWSLSMASGPHPDGGDSVIRAAEVLMGLEMKPTVVTTQLA